ncbi:hypothetical protein [Sanguibacter keddieii]|uniref:hypothetical protein n=1 Tax=Sanguibacter keddieii TaxID=60920 RepID=UPI000660E2A1|nr:hypothetical protein [Sanguibacter keddieii]
MHLEGHHEDNGWLRSTFTLTNRVSWEMMLQAVYAAFEYFADITIFVDDQSIKLESRADVLSIPEARSIGIAGESVVVKEPMIIIFYNQVHFINLRIRCGNDDLRDLDYEGFNKIVCPIVDAIELAMYQEPVPAPVKEDATEETDEGGEEKESEETGEKAASPTDDAEQTEDTGDGEQVETPGDSEPEDAAAESAQEDQAAEAPSAEPPIPPPPAAEPQDSTTPSDAPTSAAEPPIPLPPSEASAPPIPALAPRKRSEFRCN